MLLGTGMAFCHEKTRQGEPWRVRKGKAPSQGLWYDGKMNSFQDFVIWWNSQPWSIAASEWIRDTGISPGYLGTLLAFVVLGAFGVFRDRK